MKCPYCAEDIKDDAVVCRHCHGNFFIVQPTMEKLRVAEARVRELEKLLENAGGAAPAPASTAAIQAAAAAVDNRVPTLGQTEAAVLAIAVLTAAHYFLIIVIDAPLIYLRLISIVVPLAVGFLCRRTHGRGAFDDLMAGLAIAIVSILIMSWSVAKVDNVPVLPTDQQGWVEFAQYAASIGFGYFAGCAIRQWVVAARSPPPAAGYFAEVLARFIVRKTENEEDRDESDRPRDDLDRTIRKLESFAAVLKIVVASAVSIYTAYASL